MLTLVIRAGRWDKTSLSERLERSLAGGPPDPGRLAARLIFHFGDNQPPSRQALMDFLAGEDSLHRRFGDARGKQGPVVVLDPTVMSKLPEKMVSYPLPQLPSVRSLREWLGLHAHELNWFADRERGQSRVDNSRLHHYRYQWIEKRSGVPRLIEIPKNRLRAIQRRILKEILNRVPPHSTAHGFTRGRSSLSYVSPHVGKQVVLRMDLKDFFHRVPVARIGALFRRLGYPWVVAHLLQGLCTHATSASLAGQQFQTLPWETRKCLRDKHLPQGAPTSPAIANLCSWRLDCRLQGLADRFNLDYTRYADDLAFSGGMELIRLAPFLQGLIGAIAIEEGFTVNHRKTRVRTQAQSQRLAGVVINNKPNISRVEFDRLKAILHNAIRFGPESQNRQGVIDFKAHLEGRVAYVSWINPARGEKLKRLWERIAWQE
jgi:hypothetical protein